MEIISVSRIRGKGKVGIDHEGMYLLVIQFSRLLIHGKGLKFLPGKKETVPWERYDDSESAFL